MDTVPGTDGAGGGADHAAGDAAGDQGGGANYAWYLPRGTGWVAPSWSRLAYAVGSPALMGHLSLRLVR